MKKQKTKQNNSINHRIKISALLLACVSILVCGCGAAIKDKEQVENNGSTNENVEKTSTVYDDAVYLIINNSLVDDTNLDNIKDTASENVIESIRNHSYNSDTNAVISEKYEFGECIFIQTNSNSINHMYKLHIVDNKISDCVIYNLYE